MTLAMRRVSFVALALGTIAVGLTVHRAGIVEPRWLRDVVGDALWAVMLAWWVGALAPAAAMTVRAITALGICFAVEASQLLHTPALDSIRRTAVGQLVLGNGFDPRDFAAYTAGVALAVMIERALLRR